MTTPEPLLILPVAAMVSLQISAPNRDGDKVHNARHIAELGHLIGPRGAILDWFGKHMGRASPWTMLLCENQATKRCPDLFRGRIDDRPLCAWFSVQWPAADDVSLSALASDASNAALDERAQIAIDPFHAAIANAPGLMWTSLWEARATRGSERRSAHGAWPAEAPGAHPLNPLPSPLHEASFELCVASGLARIERERLSNAISAAPISPSSLSHAL